MTAFFWLLAPGILLYIVIRYDMMEGDTQHAPPGNIVERKLADGTSYHVIEE